MRRTVMHGRPDGGLATSGPRATNLTTASFDSVPAAALTMHQPRDPRHVVRNAS